METETHKRLQIGFLLPFFRVSMVDLETATIFVSPLHHGLKRKATDQKHAFNTDNGSLVNYYWGKKQTFQSLTSRKPAVSFDLSRPS